MRNHTAKPFEARSNDYICVGFEGNNRILVKDNHGKITKVNRKDVTPIEMDFKIAEFSKKVDRTQKSEMHNLLCQPAEFQTLTGSLTKIFNS